MADREEENLLGGGRLGEEYRGLLLRLIDDIKEDLHKLVDDHGETNKTARSAFLRVEECEKKVVKLEGQEREAKDDIVQLKADARSAGLVMGAVAGVIVSILTAFVLNLLRLQ